MQSLNRLAKPVCVNNVVREISSARFKQGERIAKDFVCLAESAALRCSQLPVCGGAYETNQVVEWCAIFVGLFGRSSIRTADRQVRSDSGGVGGGPRIDGDQRGAGRGPKACADRKARGGARQRGRLRARGGWSPSGLLHSGEKL